MTCDWCVWKFFQRSAFFVERSSPPFPFFKQKREEKKVRLLSPSQLPCFSTYGFLLIFNYLGVLNQNVITAVNGEQGEIDCYTTRFACKFTAYLKQKMWKNQARQQVIAVIGSLTKLGNRSIPRKIDQCHLFFLLSNQESELSHVGKINTICAVRKKPHQQRGQSDILTTPRGMDQCQSLSHE